MKYIKTFEKFDVLKEKPPVEIASDMNTFNDNENWIKDFNTRKNQLMNIYKTYKEDATPTEATSTDLYNKLVSGKYIKPSNVKAKIVFNNPLFTIYSEICKKTRELNNINGTLQQKQNELIEKQRAVAANEIDRETANTDVENINNDIQAKTDQLSQIKKDITNLQKASKDDFTDRIKNLTTSKTRITKLDNPTP